jgi:hypothetical protein
MKGKEINCKRFKEEFPRRYSEIRENGAVSDIG